MAGILFWLECFFLFGVEPYSHFGRRGRKEPEALAAASLKRLFVENRSEERRVGKEC